MIRLPQWSICAVFLAGCASLPPPLVEPDVQTGVPWGLAWIPPSGEVAIKAGAVEHVLYPDATAEKPARTPILPRTSADPHVQGSVPSSLPTRRRPQPITRGKFHASPRDCDLQEAPVPARFFFESVPPVSDLAARAGEACAVGK